MASKSRPLMVRVTARDARTMRALLGDHPIDASCSGPQTMADGRVVLNVQIEAGAIDRLRRRGVGIEVLYDVEARARRLKKQIGQDNRFLGNVRYPRGLGRLVPGDRHVP